MVIFLALQQMILRLQADHEKIQLATHVLERLLSLSMLIMEKPYLQMPCPNRGAFSEKVRKPTVPVYEEMIIGEHNRHQEIEATACKEIKYNI